jgi:hypothetical protein
MSTTTETTTDSKPTTSWIDYVRNFFVKKPASPETSSTVGSTSTSTQQPVHPESRTGGGKSRRNAKGKNIRKRKTLKKTTAKNYMYNISKWNPLK